MTSPLTSSRPERRVYARALGLDRPRSVTTGTVPALRQGRPDPRAGLGKGTVFRRFGTRAGIFAALLDDDERAFQQQVLAGPPPLGPGAAPLDRLIAYGRARTGFLIAHCDLARAALDGHQPVPAGSQSPLSRVHIRMLLVQMDLGGADLDMLAVQLTAALDGPQLLYLSAPDLTATSQAAERIADSWQDLVQRICRP